MFHCSMNCRSSVLEGTKLRFGEDGSSAAILVTWLYWNLITTMENDGIDFLFFSLMSLSTSCCNWEFLKKKTFLVIIPIIFENKIQATGWDAKFCVQVTDRMLKHAKHVYPYNTPNTKEAYFYRMIFEKHFPQVSHTPWTYHLFWFWIEKNSNLVAMVFCVYDECTVQWSRPCPLCWAIIRCQRSPLGWARHAMHPT